MDSGDDDDGGGDGSGNSSDEPADLITDDEADDIAAPDFWAPLDVSVIRKDPTRRGSWLKLCRSPS